MNANELKLYDKYNGYKTGDIEDLLEDQYAYLNSPFVANRKYANIKLVEILELILDQRFN